MKKEDLQHHLLITYSVSKKAQKEKVRIMRELLGYKEAKNKKQYEHAGLLSRWYGKKLSSGVLLIPAGFGLQLSSYFQKNKIEHKILEIWIE